MSKQKQHPTEFRARVALEAVKGEQTITKLTSRTRVHPAMIDQWKWTLHEGESSMCEHSGTKDPEIDKEQFSELHAKIGQLTSVNDFFQKAQALDRQVSLLSCSAFDSS